MIELSLSDLFTFTFCSDAENLSKKDLRRPFLDFFDDIINTLFLPEFPVSQTVATYSLIFIVAFISGENAKKVNVESFSIIFSYIRLILAITIILVVSINIYVKILYLFVFDLFIYL